MKRLALLLTLLILTLPTAALAKGGPFSYITIKGPGISETLSVTDPALLDYFVFADFSKGGIDVPANPGEGYQVIRSFVDSETNKVQNWDLLYYYPDTGYVYYNGLINGSSEYDGKWYMAKPDVEAKFRAVLAEQSRLVWLPYAALVVMLIVFGVAYYRKK
jgi:hypothetical protein